MRRLWLVRHGPTHARGLVGWTDLPADLSDAAALGRLRALLPPGVPVVSSDLGRAVATADALAPAGPRLPHDARLREIHFGDWEGRHYGELPEAETRAFWAGEAAAPGGEAWGALAARVAAALAALPPRAVVVAHFGAILAALQWATRCTLAEALAQRIDPLSLTELAETEGGWQVPRINHRP